MTSCRQCLIMNNDFIYPIDIQLSTYLMVGAIIWIVKIFISLYFTGPSTTRSENYITNLIILIIFFAPNIIFWPINLCLDIYSIAAEYLSLYTAKDLAIALIGF